MANLPTVSTTPAANFATGTAGVDTGGAPRAANISTNFRKNSKLPLCSQGLGETDSYIKPEVENLLALSL